MEKNNNTLTETQKTVLSTLLARQLEVNWDILDKLSSFSEAYSYLSDECTQIHGIARSLGVSLPEEVDARH